MSTSSTSTSASTAAPDDNDDNSDDAIMQSLTPELRRMTKAFQAIGDDKLRYKQLLYMANQLPSMDKSSMIAPNKVPGCLSTVYIDGRATVQTVVEKDENDGIEEGDSKKQQLVIEFTGDSDGLLTKGLVALLVRGLSNNTASAIQRIDPAFIARAGISASLTPGRNNGFLNMLAVMKRRALQLEQEAAMSEAPAVSDSSSSSSSDALEQESTSTSITSSSPSTFTPMYDAMMEQVQKLQPTQLILTNVSHQHADHAGMKDASNTQESHFELDIVADAFDGLNLIKRHQLVYMMLSNEMPQIRSLQIIRAKTPAEVAEEQEKP
jgi:sulfur transfer protein SufE/stress-induced morphogen